MRPIDADTLQTALIDEYNGIPGYKTREKFYRAIEIVRRQPTISLPPNDPLTLEQLREMVGNPVYIERYDGGPSRWAIVGDFESLYGIYFGTAQGGLRLPYDFSGKTWLAYRRKPEEGET